MVKKLVGFKSFHSDKKNDDYLFLSCEGSDSSFCGVTCSQYFFSGTYNPEAIKLGKSLSPDNLGSEIEVYFNESGKPDFFKFRK